MVLYEAFVRWGLLKGILSDQESRFKAHQLHGEAEYEYMPRRLEIDRYYGKKPQTKETIEFK
jgi:hypothetical protein